MSIDKKRIFKHFEGMDQHYKAQLERYNQVNNDKYSLEYINKKKAEIKKAILDDKKERVNKAKEEIELIRKKATEKPFKDPYDEIKDPVIKPEHKIMIEMQRMTNMMMFKEELAVADSVEELREVYDQNRSDKDFYKLFQLDLKQRMKNSENSSQFQLLNHELNQEPQEFKEFKNIESALNMVEHGEDYPAGLEEHQDYKSIAFSQLFPGENSSTSTAQMVAMKQAGY